MIRCYASDTIQRLGERLVRLYPNHDRDDLLRRLLLLDGRYGVGSNPGVANELWDETDSVLITYGDSIRKTGEMPLETLKRFADDFLHDAFSTIHVLPFFPFSSDDGFSVMDYRLVRSDLGDWRHLQSLGENFHLMYDLVLNHASRQGDWFKQYTLDVAPFRDYFVEADPDKDYSMVVRPRNLPLLSAVNKQGERKHVWTTFSRDQVDLDFRNPDVLFEFLDVLSFYLSRGARILRLDAIAYLWKEVGTSCIHLPQTHELVKLLRDFVTMIEPRTIILTETNVPHEENIAYFGHGDEAHMIYQFSLPPLILHALQTGNGRYLTAWARGLPEPPPGCTFLNFTASHDGIGVRPLKGLIPDDELDAVVHGVTERGGRVSMKANTDGSESPYELNITWFDALSDPQNPDRDLQIRRVLCSQAIMMAMKGIPAVYIHSLTATPNDLKGVKESGRARSINRRMWADTELRHLLGDETSVQAAVFPEMVRMLTLRSRHAAFHPDSAQHIGDTDAECFAILRTSRDGMSKILALHNLTASTITVPLVHTDLFETVGGVDMIADTPISADATEVDLSPYQVRWIRMTYA